MTRNKEVSEDRFFVTSISFYFFLGKLINFNKTSNGNFKEKTLEEVVEFSRYTGTFRRTTLTSGRLSEQMVRYVKTIPCVKEVESQCCCYFHSILD